MFTLDLIVIIVRFLHSSLTYNMILNLYVLSNAFFIIFLE